MASHESTYSSKNMTIWTFTNRLTTIPPLRAGAAFFTFLRHNLSLSPASPTTTTHLERFGSALSLPSRLTPLYETPSCQSISNSTPFYTSASSTSPTGCDDALSLPTPVTQQLSSPSEKREALALIAASIAEQRRVFEHAVLLDPRVILAYLFIMALLVQFLIHNAAHLRTIIFVPIAGTVCLLVLLRLVGMKYDRIAKSLTTSYFCNDADRYAEEDIVIGTYLHSTLAAVLVLRVERSPCHYHQRSTSSSSSTNSTKASKKNPTSTSNRGSYSHHRTGSRIGNGNKGIIRSWVVSPPHRHRGLGRAVLLEAIKRTRERVGRDVEIGFAVEHAHAARVGWSWMGNVFRRGERKAASTLQGLLASGSGKGRGRHRRGVSL